SGRFRARSGSGGNGLFRSPYLHQNRLTAYGWQRTDKGVVLQGSPLFVCRLPLFCALPCAAGRMPSAIFPPMESSPCPLVTPLVDFQLSLLETTRRKALEIAGGLTPEQLLAVPKGFHNNILWNLGHLVASQQVLCY